MFISSYCFKLLIWVLVSFLSLLVPWIFCFISLWVVFISSLFFDQAQSDLWASWLPMFWTPHQIGWLSPCLALFLEFGLFFRLGHISLFWCTSLVGLVDCFFNSFIVRVPRRLILWHFWLFIDFRLVVILLLVVWGSEGFLPTAPSWSEPQRIWFCFFETWSIVQYGQWKQKERKVPSVVPCWHLLFILGITPQCLSTRKVVDSSGMSMSVDGNGV